MNLCCVSLDLVTSVRIRYTPSCQYFNLAFAI